MLSRDELIQCKLAIKSKFEITWWKVKGQLQHYQLLHCKRACHIRNHGNDGDGDTSGDDADGDDDDSDGDLLGNGWLRVMQAVHL